MYGENKQNKTPEYVRKRGRAEKGLRNRHCRSGGPFKDALFSLKNCGRQERKEEKHGTLPFMAV